MAARPGGLGGAGLGLGCGGLGQAEIAGLLTNGRIGLPHQSDVIRELATDPTWNHTASAWLTSMFVLVLRGALLLGAAVLALRRMRRLSRISWPGRLFRGGGRVGR